MNTAIKPKGIQLPKDIHLFTTLLAMAFGTVAAAIHLSLISYFLAG